MKRIIRINGEVVEPASADIVETEPGVYSVITEKLSREARVSGDTISIAGETFVFEVEDPRRWKGTKRADGPQGRISLTAAMPGKIVRVLVAPGDEVAAGQGIMTIEAMKMQNEMKAPRAGRVTAIEVRENESVNAGAVLVTIE